MTIKNEIVDEFLKGYKNPTDFKEIWNDLQKALLERMLQGEMTNHLGYEKTKRERTLKTAGMGRPKRALLANLEKWKLKFPGTGQVNLSLRSSRKDREDLQGLTIKSYQCTQEE